MGNFGSKGGLARIAPIKQRPLGQYFRGLSESIEEEADLFVYHHGKIYATKDPLTQSTPSRNKTCAREGQKVFMYFQRGSDELVGIETENGKTVFRNEHWIETIERHNRLYR